MNLTESPLLTTARRLLAAYPDTQILVSQTHTTPDEAEILARLNRVQHQVMREYGVQWSMALAAVNKAVRERREAAKEKAK